MKKQVTVIGLLLVMAMVLTGCSWNDIKAKFIGEDTAATGSAVSLTDYDPDDYVTLGEYKGVEVDCTVSDEEIQAEIDELIDANKTNKKIKKGKCKKGQTVNIDYVGKLNGKAFDNGSATDTNIELGKSGYIDGFDDGVIGMKVGQKKDLNLTFPSDYHEESLAGKDVVFTVTLNYIQGKEITPEFNDALVKKATEYKTTDEFKQKTREELSNKKKDSAGSTAMDIAEKNSTFKSIPEELKASCRSQMDSYYRYTATSYGFADLNAFLQASGMSETAYQTELSNNAETLAKTWLMTFAIAKKENIVITDEDIKKEIDAIVTQNAAAGADEAALRDQFKAIYGDTITLEEYYRIQLMNTQVIELLSNNAKIKA
ncbi:MAG: trigger factor [Lachnospiraceae bacterium]|nr:trigger factor [Lachnospiraceae bacterium]